MTTTLGPSAVDILAERLPAEVRLAAVTADGTSQGVRWSMVPRPIR